MSLKNWSTTPSSNATVDSINFAEGQAPSSVNDSARALMADVRAALYTKGSDIASATTTDLAAASTEGLFHDVTGTTTVTGLGTVAAGVWKVIKFEGALTLTHNATSLILPGAANITTADGDVGIFVSEGSGNWRCVNYLAATGRPIIQSLLDSVFRILDNLDATKIAAFECSGISAGTTRTFTLPDASGTIALLGLVQTFSALQTFSAGIALSGTASNVTLGANYISYGGTDAGISLDASNNVMMSANLTAPGLIKSTRDSVGFQTIPATATTSAVLMFQNGGGSSYLGIENSAGSGFFTSGSSAYDSFMSFPSSKAFSVGVDGGAVVQRWTSTGTSVTGNLTVSGTGTNSFSGNVGITKATGAPILSLVASTGTNEAYIALTNNSETAYVGKENSAGSWFGGTAYATVVQAPSGRVVQAIIAGTPKLTVSGSAVTVADNLTVSGTGTIAGHGTTASAANTYIDSSTGLISRSTSAMKYKRDAEPINSDVASKVLSLKPIWYRSNTELCVNDNPAHSWYGLGAEEVAAVDPRFVFFGYDAEDYEDVIIDERVEVPLMETEMVPFKRIEMRDGVPTLITGTEPVKTQKTQPVAVVDEAGNDVFEDQRIENEDGGVTVNRVQLFHDVPQFTTEIKTRTERRLKAGAVKRPQGVDYARLIVPLLPKLKVLLDP